MTSTASRPLSAHEAAFYGREAVRVEPETAAEAGALLAEAQRGGRPVIPAGVGAHAYLGNPPPAGALVVSCARLARILRYEPGDFTLGAEAGTPLGALREATRAHGQELPFDVALDEEGTLGGRISTAEPHLRSGRHGLVRTSVLGVRALRSGGEAYKAGGMVVKNVAGYEVAKLLTGALGTAGLLLEVNLRLRPLPACRALRSAWLPSAGAAWALAARIQASRAEPSALVVEAGKIETESGIAPQGGAARVSWLLEGSTERVCWQVEEALRAAGEGQTPSPWIESAAQEAIEGALDALGRHATPGKTPPQELAIARISTLPTRCAPITEELLAIAPGAVAIQGDALAGLITIRWRGARDLLTGGIDALRGLARAHGLQGAVLYLPPALRRAEEHLLDRSPTADLARRVLAPLSPRGLLCPGRILGPAHPSLSPNPVGGGAI